MLPESETERCHEPWHSVPTCWSSVSSPKVNVEMHLSVAMSHSLHVLSPLADSTLEPSSVHDRENTEPSCSCGSSPMRSPVFPSNS